MNFVFYGLCDIIAYFADRASPTSHDGIA